MRYFSFTLLGLFLFFSCSKKPELDLDVSNIDIEINLNRFDIDFYTSKTEDFPDLKNKYPFLFPKDIPDSIWIAKKMNKDELELFLDFYPELHVMGTSVGNYLGLSCTMPVVYREPILFNTIMNLNLRCVLLVVVVFDNE